MTDPNANPNGQVPGQQADANPTEPLNAMTGEAGTAANNAPTQALAAGEQPTQAFTPVAAYAGVYTCRAVHPASCAGQSAGTAYAGFATSDSCRCARARTDSARACARTSSTQFALSGGGSGRRIGSSGLRQRQCSGISGRRGRASANAL